MSSKPKAEPKVAVLKGQEAEDKILEYVKKMNRPYGAVDVAANLKGAVPKTATQKILVALAEKGELVQKVYGKTTFFVYNQAKIDCLPQEKITALNTELVKLEDANKELVTQVRTLTTDFAKIKSTPTDAEIDNQISNTKELILIANKTLDPLRSGAPPISAEQLEQIYADWTKWRAEWVRRRKVFLTFWQLATDALPPQDAKDLEEDLGIEKDTPEHVNVEQGALCRQNQASTLKRKRQ
ncbi:TBPIP-domain-containing protein [Pholiota conissans]|uniref:TBPIP-domain-containing protein n=1 Tax=Pholiota conissans TaxID=109636 RepID=A0A9P6D376_9AGAR|nr:TBPIP-domain-containing protein [Pholiota conissans]